MISSSVKTIPDIAQKLFGSKKELVFVTQRAISLDGSSLTISFPLSQSEWHQSGECKIWRLFFIKKIVTNRALITSKRLFSYESLVKNLILEGTLNIQLS